MEPGADKKKNSVLESAFHKLKKSRKGTIMSLFGRWESKVYII